MSEKYQLYAFILFNNYLILLLNYYCSIITKVLVDYEKLFTQSLSITIYLGIVNIFIDLLKIALLNTYNKLYFQIIITSILFFIPIFLILMCLKYAFYLIFFKDCLDNNDKNTTCNLCHCCNMNCPKCFCRCLCCEPCYSNFIRKCLKCFSFYFTNEKFDYLFIKDN